MMWRPKVSIGMPAINAASTIGIAITSILIQDYPDWELIVIDDGSSDGTQEIVQGFGDERIRYLSDGARRGVAARMNQAVSLSRGEFFARMDADDICYQERLSSQVDFLQRRPYLSLTGSWVCVFRGEGVPLGKRGAPSQGAPFRLTSWIPIPHPTFCGRRAWFVRNPYNDAASGFEDQFLLLTSYGRSSFAVLPRILLGYREERLRVAKQIRYRTAYFRTFPHLVKELGLLRSLVVSASHFPKLIAEIALLTLGREDVLLRHRQAPLEPGELEQWTRLWNLVQKRLA